MSLAGNWESYITAQGDNTGWQAATTGRMHEIIGWQWHQNHHT